MTSFVPPRLKAAAHCCRSATKSTRIA